MTETLTTITPCSTGACKLDEGHGGVCRDRYTRPLIAGPGNKKPLAYTRATTFVDCVEDKFALQQWGKRMVAVGLAVRPDLLLRVPEYADDRDTLNDICEQALSEAKAHDKRERGTLLHALSECADAEAEFPEGTTDADRAAIWAYVQATKCLTHLETERLTVHDDLKVAGTPDRISACDIPDPSGNVGNRIVDLKSGNTAFGQLKMAGQLALYSRAQFIDLDTWERTPLPDVNQEWGIIVDLDAADDDTPATCTLHWIDLTLGWAVVEEADRIRAMRNKARTALQPFARGFDLAGLIDLAADADTIRALWSAHSAEWTDALTARAKARIAALAA